MSDDNPWKNFPGGNPFANFPGGNPFGPGGPFAGGNPFDGNLDEWFRSMGIDPQEFQKLFQQMQRDLQEAFKNMGDDPNKNFMAGFNVRMGPDGKPHINTFGNKPTPRKTEDGLKIGSSEREPLTDVIEEGAQVAVTMELPGVEKSDIKIQMNERSLEISVDNDERKYHKRVKLPARVDPKTTKATYKNGVLDVTVQKAEPDEGGVEITIE